MFADGPQNIIDQIPWTSIASILGATVGGGLAALAGVLRWLWGEIKTVNAEWRADQKEFTKEMRENDRVRLTLLSEMHQQTAIGAQRWETVGDTLTQLKEDTEAIKALGPKLDAIGRDTSTIKTSVEILRDRCPAVERPSGAMPKLPMQSPPN